MAKKESSTQGPWWERERVSYVADVERLKRDASDLLAALTRFAHIADEVEGATQTHVPCSMRVEDLQAARAAVAKARG
jgi:hypothetical protein